MMQEIKFKNFTWLDIKNPGPEDVRRLSEKYELHPLHLKYILTPSQRTKMDVQNGYAYAAFLFPYYNRRTREIKPAEVELFVSGKYIITTHTNRLESFTKFVRNFIRQKDLTNDYPDRSPERLLYGILEELYSYLYPMVDHLIIDSDNVEKEIFTGHENKMVQEILIVRRNITDFRKIAQVHKNILKKMQHYFRDDVQYVMKKTDIYYENLIDHAKEIWDALENLKERIEALQETNESRLAFKLNDIMKTLTIISVITFPITLMAGIFGMNTIKSMPLVGDPNGFWIILAFMVSVALAMLAAFKKKGWF